MTNDTPLYATNRAHTYISGIPKGLQEGPQEVKTPPWGPGQGIWDTVMALSRVLWEGPRGGVRGGLQASGRGPGGSKTVILGSGIYVIFDVLGRYRENDLRDVKNRNSHFIEKHKITYLKSSYACARK